MAKEVDDPDTLQMLDEADVEWVRAWKQKTDSEVKSTQKQTCIKGRAEKPEALRNPRQQGGCRVDNFHVESGEQKSEEKP